MSKKKDKARKEAEDAVVKMMVDSMYEYLRQELKMPKERARKLCKELEAILRKNLAEEINDEKTEKAIDALMQKYGVEEAGKSIKQSC